MEEEDLNFVFFFLFLLRLFSLDWNGNHLTFLAHWLLFFSPFFLKKIRKERARKGKRILLSKRAVYRSVSI